MVYYLRFLKPPKLDTQKNIVRALVTITTDLGDGFYAGDLALHVIVVTSECESDWQSAWQVVKWKNGMRSVWVEIGDLKSSPPTLLKLVVSTRQRLLAEDLQLDHLPEVLSGRSAPFGRCEGWEKTQAEGQVERRFTTEGGEDRIIYEETGESIARHVW